MVEVQVAGLEPYHEAEPADPVQKLPAADPTPEEALETLARKEAQGMVAIGPAFTDDLQQGDTREHSFQLQAGKCYTVLAVGDGLTELDLQIVLHQPPMPPYLVAQDETTGPNAVLGGSGNCFRNPIPIAAPAQVVVKATEGRGTVWARIYAR